MGPALISHPESGGLQNTRDIERYSHISQREEKNQDVIRFDSICASKVKELEQVAQMIKIPMIVQSKKRTN